MAQNVFRITPRVSQVIRAIEKRLQLDNDAVYIEEGNGCRRVIFNAGDFKFEDGKDGVTVVKVSELEMAYTLQRDPEFVLYHQTFEGEVILRKHRQKMRGRKAFVYYTTESIGLDRVEELDEAA